MSERPDYIFCINTGRSGSEYLSRIFAQVPGCLSFHEPLPKGNGAAMRRFARGDDGPIREVARRKAEAIRAHRRDGRTYVETNHCFVKGFGWALPDHLPDERTGIVILTRDPGAVAESYLRIGCSPLVPRGRRWLTTPDARNPLVPPPAPLISAAASYALARAVKLAFRCARFAGRAVFGRELRAPGWLTEYERRCLLWYVEETAAQARAFRERFPRMRFYEVDVERLNSLEEVRRMLEYFGCAAGPSLADVVGKPTNVKRAAARDASPAR